MFAYSRVFELLTSGFVNWDFLRNGPLFGRQNDACMQDFLGHAIKIKYTVLCIVTVLVLRKHIQNET